VRGLPLSLRPPEWLRTVVQPEVSLKAFSDGLREAVALGQFLSVCPSFTLEYQGSCFSPGSLSQPVGTSLLSLAPF
jgi:hypothetical protein